MNFGFPMNKPRTIKSQRSLKVILNARSERGIEGQHSSMTMHILPHQAIHYDMPMMLRQLNYSITAGM